MTALVASRTSTLVTVRVAVFAMVVPIESLRRPAGALGTVGVGGLGAGGLGAGDAGGSASRRRGFLAGGGASGSVCGTRVRPHGPDEDGASAGGGASYWPRRLGPGVGGGASCATWPL